MIENTPVPMRRAQQLLPRIVEVASEPDAYVRIADDQGREVVVIAASTHERLREIARAVEDDERFNAEMNSRAAEGGSRSKTVTDAELDGFLVSPPAT